MPVYQTPFDNIEAKRELAYNEPFHLLQQYFQLNSMSCLSLKGSFHLVDYICSKLSATVSLYVGKNKQVSCLFPATCDICSYRMAFYLFQRQLHAIFKFLQALQIQLRQLLTNCLICNQHCLSCSYRNIPKYEKRSQSKISLYEFTLTTLTWMSYLINYNYKQ